MSIFSCFDDVIGLTRKEDICVEGYEDSYANSESGLYIDEMQGMSLRILDATGGKDSIWDKMHNARENAINAFKVDSMREILKTKEPARKKFIGDIGGKSFTATVADATYHGIRVYSDIKGGSFTLRGITIILSTTENINLLIYSGETDEDGAAPLHTIPISSLAGRPKYNAITPIELSLTGNYYFVYESVGLPYNNYLTCNCGRYKWCFNINNPCYKYSRDKWTEWAMAAGVKGDDLTVRDDWGMSRHAMGLRLHGDFGCDTLAILCSDHSDWSGNMVDQAIAWAVLFKAGSFLSSYIMDSDEVNRYTLLGVEGLAANIVYYEERYKAMIEFIAENIEEDRNECLKCKDRYGFALQSQVL